MMNDEEMIELITYRQDKDIQNIRYRELESKYIASFLSDLAVYNLDLLNNFMKKIYATLSAYDILPFPFIKGDKYYVIYEGKIIEVDNEGYDRFKDEINQHIKTWDLPKT